ncbi:MAG: hypothetical protein KME17_06985 [Cyanosarcina radialis HA8281-LM2]|jgi:hypothetical protein|nr:hypothetical protein [Cyanosarcina radialis HA8281-LM2]
MRHSLVLAGLLTGLSSMAIPQIAKAQTPPIVTSDPGLITAYFTGWVNASSRVVTTAPFPPNTGCTVTDGYITNPADPGNKTHQDALLMAYSTGKRVQLTVQGCYVGRPRIIGVIVLPR